MIEICGYAAVYHHVVDGLEAGGLCRILPGAFRANCGTIELRLNHEQPRQGGFASVRGGTLKLLPDSHGLGFEARIDGDAARWLFDELQSGRLSGVSIGPSINCTTEPVVENGRTIQNITQIEIDEISLAHAPRDTKARCWLANHYEPALSDAQRDARLFFRLARQERQLKARGGRPAAKFASKRTAVPPSVVALMNQPWWPDVAARHRAAAALFEHNERA